MNENSLSLRFYGVEGLSLATLRAKELGDLIIALEDAVVTLVRAHDSEIRREQIAVSLTSVADGSIALAFRPSLQEFTVPAARKIVEAFTENNFRQLPPRVLGPLRVITSFVQRRGCIAEFRVGQDDAAISARITPETRIETFLRVEGDTEIYCDVIRVGGVEPRVEVKTIQGDTLYCDASHEIAKQLAEHLYESVKLYGKATWNFDTYTIESFRILRLHPIEDTPFTETLEAIRRAAGDYFDEIEDVEQWVSSLREDEDLVYGDSLLGH